MAITGTDLLTTEFAQRESVVGNIILLGSYNLLYGGTGTGKSYFAMSMSNAIAAGSRFLRWDCPQRRVLYIDGELGQQAMRDRYAVAYNSGTEYEGRWFTMHSFDDAIHDKGRKRLPQFSDKRAWPWWDKLVAEHDVIVIDNLGTLVQEDHEQRGDNEFRAWNRFRDYLWMWKSRQKTFIVIHHANKDGLRFAGGQKKQDDSDLTLGLHKLSPLRGPDGKQHIELKFEKVRHLTWPATMPLHLTYDVTDARINWTVDSMDSYHGEQIRYLESMNMKPGTISKELKIPIWRMKQLRSVMPEGQTMLQEEMNYENDGEIFWAITRRGIARIS